MGLSYYRASQSNIFTTKIVSGTTTYQVTSADSGIGVGSGVSNILLPANPQSNQRLKIFDYQGDAFSNNIIIDGNGNTINGDSSVEINTDGGSLELIFVETTWHITSFVN